LDSSVLFNASLLMASIKAQAKEARIDQSLSNIPKQTQTAVCLTQQTTAAAIAGNATAGKISMIFTAIEPCKPGWR